jgi:WD40 repeat protein
MTMNKSRNVLATISNSPMNALHTYNIETREWTELLLPSSVVSSLISAEFSPKSSHILFVLSANSLYVYDIKKPSGPQRVISLSTFSCEHMSLVPTALAAAIVAAKGGKILLIDTGPKAR